MAEDKFKITMFVQGRELSMSILREEEEVFREAARMINNRIAQYKGKHATAEPFDLLAITAIQFTVGLIMAEQKNNVEPILKRLREVSQKLEELVNE